MKPLINNKYFRIKNKLVFLVISLILFYCSSPKLLYKTGGIDRAKKNIIELILAKQSKKGDYFEISLRDTIPEYYVFYVKKNKKKVFNKNKVNFPSQFVEKNGRLFFWKDSTKNVSSEIIKIMKKYNAINLSLVTTTGYKKLDSLKLLALKPKKHINFEEFEKENVLDNFISVLDSIYKKNKSDSKLKDLEEALLNCNCKEKGNQYFSYYVCIKDLSVIKIKKGLGINLLNKKKHTCNN